MNYRRYAVFGLVVCLFLGGVLLYTRVYSPVKPTTSYDSSLENVKKRGKLVIASDIEFEPMEFYDKDGTPVGLDMDIVREVARVLGVTPEIRMVYWDKLFQTVKDGEVDIGISSVTILPERTKEMLFTHPYFDSGQVFLVRKNETRILTLSDLKGKKVAVFPDTSGKAEVSKYVDGKDMIDYQTFEVPKDNPKGGILNDLETGKIDVIITDYIGALGNIKNNPELKIAGEPFTQEYYGMISKLGNQSLVNRIDEILEEMKTNGKMREIQNTWLKTY